MPNMENWKARPIKIGTKETIRMIEQGKAAEVYLAKNADTEITERIAGLCHKFSIHIQYVETMRMLGKISGIEVGAAAVTVLKNE